MTKTRQISNILEDYHEDESDDEENNDCAALHRIEIRASPFLDTSYHHHNVQVTLDCGATGDMIRASTARARDIPITKATQSAKQADGHSLFLVIGEARMLLTHGDRELLFAGLVVENLDVDILADMPCMHGNEVGVFPARHESYLVMGQCIATSLNHPLNPYTQYVVL